MSEHSTDHPILLLHSSGLGAAQWRRTLEHLPRAVAPDLCGYGGRPWAGLPDFAWRDDLRVAEEALDALGNAHVVGHSYGGFLALQLARRRPVRSVVAWEPVAFSLLGGEIVRQQGAFLDRSRGLEDWLRRFIGFWSGPEAWDRLGERRRAPFLGAWPPLRSGRSADASTPPSAPDDPCVRPIRGGSSVRPRRGSASRSTPSATMARLLAHGEVVYAEVLRLAEDPTRREDWAEIQAPALLLSGGQTRPESAEVAAILARAIPGGVHRVVPGAGHMGPVTHGAELERELRRWFEEVDRGAQTPSTPR